MSRIAIVDPALGRTGAHNLGFASLLLGRGAQVRDLGVWCNTSIDETLRQPLVACGVAVDPTFEVDFYAVTNKPGGIAEHWDWVYALARQYIETFERIATHWPSGPVHLLHHSLSWEHASALALAIRLAGGRFGRLLHHAFLMYSPGVDAAGSTYDADRRFDYRLAFEALDALAGVRLYAGCSEYASAYARLLERLGDLPIHPCFLGDWSAPLLAGRRDRIRTLLLYVGEIKQEKGFLRLPRRLEALLAMAGSEHRFVIQFVKVRNRAAQKILGELEAIASRDSRVELHHGLWDDSTLQTAFRNADALCLDYDTSAYAHQSSGLLWLAAWHGLDVCLPGGTWLEREAGRLGVPVTTDVTRLMSGKRLKRSGKRDQHYFATLFQPFWGWLERQCDDLARSGAQPAAQSIALPKHDLAKAPQTRTGAGMREPGADIVLFWKQNDSCLYGRHHDMVARYLASRADVRRVIVVDAPIGEANLAKLLEGDPAVHQGPRVHALTRLKERGACDTDKIRYKVFVCPAGKFRFGDDHSGRPHFLEGYEAFLRDAFAAEGIDPKRTVFWIYPKNFYMPHLLDAFQPARVVVDVEDDHRAWPGVKEALRQQLTENYRALLNRADMAFANCAPMQQDMRRYCPTIRLVPNACDAAPPLPRRPENPLFHRLEEHRGKVIGYVGNLEAKIDIPLLHKVAEHFPDALVVLAGSTHANPKVLELRRHPNVLMPGVVPYDELGAWMHGFDVGLVPHLDIELTRYMNPQKLYAYLSWGVPVVATRVPNLDVAGGLVRVVDSHEQFMHEIEMLLDHPPAKDAFRAFVAANSWEARLSGHVDELALGDLA